MTGDLAGSSVTMTAPPLGKRMPDGSIHVHMVGVYKDVGYGVAQWEYVRCYDHDTGEGLGDPGHFSFEGDFADQIYPFTRGLIADCSELFLDDERYVVRTTLMAYESPQKTDTWHFRYDQDFRDEFDL